MGDTDVFFMTENLRVTYSPHFDKLSVSVVTADLRKKKLVRTKAGSKTSLGRDRYLQGGVMEIPCSSSRVAAVASPLRPRPPHSQTLTTFTATDVNSPVKQVSDLIRKQSVTTVKDMSPSSC